MCNFKSLSSTSPLIRPRAIYELICSIIRPKNQSDRTAFWKISLWADRKVRRREKSEQIYDLIADYAREAAGPGCKNPAAVFTSILKKELGYPK